MRTEQLTTFKEILLKEYGVSLTEEESFSEAIRLSEFAKTIIRHVLSKSINS